MTAGANVAGNDVVLAGGLYLWRGWQWIDPLTHLVIAAAIVGGTWSLFRRSLHLLFDGVPETVDLPALRERLLNLPGVQAVHDQHVFAMDTSESVLTAHLVFKDGQQDADGLLRAAAKTFTSTSNSGTSRCNSNQRRSREPALRARKPAPQNRT